MSNRRDLLKLGLVAAGGLVRIAAAATATKDCKVLLVHGRSQQGKDPKALKAEWLKALGKGAGKSHRSLAASVEVAFPFYGDVLDDFTRQADLPLTEEIGIRGDAAVDAEFLAFEAELAEAMRQQAGVSDAEVDAAYGPNPKQKGPQNWEWVQAILRTLDRRGGSLSKQALERFMRDVFLYVRRQRVRDAIDAIIRAELTDAPTIVVGHSLGSVVAYSVLLRDTRQLRVPLYLTVGSPLALSPIRQIFQPLKNPPCIASWYNAYDRRDVVALYPLDTANFPIIPAVENHAEVRNHTDNRHGIVGYLDDEKVATRLLDALPYATD